MTVGSSAADIDFDFAANWLEELCVLNGLGDRFTDAHRRAIYKGLQLMRQETSVDRRTLSYFRYLVQDYDQSVAAVLDIFSHESRNLNHTDTRNAGFISKIFDANDSAINLHTNNFNVFEMSKLMEQGDRVIIPAIRYLIHMISKQFNESEPTLIIFDECFMFFNHKIFREKIIEWIKTVRKFNVAIIFATQELTDLLKYNDLTSTLKTNCATKIFLPNQQVKSPEIMQQYIDMDINAKQIDLIAHANMGEYFYSSALGKRKFTLDLHSTPITFAFVARTSQQDIQQAILLHAHTTTNFGYHWLIHCGVASDQAESWMTMLKQY